MTDAASILPDIYHHFTYFHGMSPEQVMQTGAASTTEPRTDLGIDHRLVSLSEYSTSPHRLSQKHYEDMQRDYQEALDMPHEARVQHALRKMQGDGGASGLVWDRITPHKSAAGILALAHTLHHDSRPNNRALFRGTSARITPNQELSGIGRSRPRGALSFSEIHGAAKEFADHDGAVYRLERGEGSGIRLSDYGVSEKFYQGQPEREWLIHNISRQFIPKDHL